MTRGSSGATFRYYLESVGKMCRTDDGRTSRQGLWLRQHQSPAVPKVLSVYEHGYQMERLDDISYMWLNHRVVLAGIVEQLEQHVWSQSAEVEWSQQATVDKVADLLGMFDVGVEVQLWLEKTHESIDWNALPRCLTHGDPTLDNVMFRPGTSELVIIDPVPATSAVPDIRAVDLGKMLQSALGWERVRYGYREVTGALDTLGGSARINPYHVQTYAQDDNEWNAAVLWCVIHLLRTLPYLARCAAPKVQDDVRGMIGDATTFLP